MFINKAIIPKKIYISTCLSLDDLKDFYWFCGFQQSIKKFCYLLRPSNKQHLNEFKISGAFLSSPNFKSKPWRFTYYAMRTPDLMVMTGPAGSG